MKTSAVDALMRIFGYYRQNIILYKGFVSVLQIAMIGYYLCVKKRLINSAVAVLRRV